jgi:hypothetical protein
MRADSRLFAILFIVTFLIFNISWWSRFLMTPKMSNELWDFGFTFSVCLTFLVFGPISLVLASVELLVIAVVRGLLTRAGNKRG